MRTNDVGLLLLRAGLGATVAAHGAQKAFGWFGGGGIEGTAAAFEKGGFRPGRRHARLAAVVETGGGALLCAGLATPAAAAAVAGTMAVAGDLHRPSGFFAQRGGFEYPLSLGVAAASVALAGPGAGSVDRLLGDRLARPWMGVVGLVVALAGAARVSRQRKAAAHTERERARQSSIAAPGASDVETQAPSEAPVP